jgi:hypothetical protein
MKTALLLACLPLAALAVCDPDLQTQRLTWVRERLTPSITVEELNQAFQFLRIGTQSCPTNGDLWYYRSLVEKRLKKNSEAAFSEKKAGENRSEAFVRKLDPFVAPIRTATLSRFVREKWAVLIGVGQFKDAGASPLRYTLKDAQDLEQTLISTGRFKKGNIRLVLNEAGRGFGRLSAGSATGSNKRTWR